MLKSHQLSLLHRYMFKRFLFVNPSFICIYELTSNWKIPICLATIAFVVVQSTIIYNHLFAVHPICKLPNYSNWKRQVNFSELITYVVVLAIQMGLLALNIVPSKEFGSYALTFFISLLAGISSLINLCTDWTGDCEDLFGYFLLISSI